MIFSPMEEEPLFDRVDGVAYFHGVRVEERVAEVGGHTLKLAQLADAAELLDLPEFERRFIEEDRLPYGLELWPASRMLAEYVLRDEPGQARWGVELGCGLGLVSIAASLAGWNVHATDNDPMAIDFTKLNATANGVAIREYGLLDWRYPPTKRRYDRVFGADVLYQLVDHAPILACIDQLLAHDGIALISDPHRGVADRFAEMARAAGFHVETLAGTVPNQQGQTITGRIFILRRAQ